MSSTAGLTMILWIPESSGPIPCSEFPALWKPSEKGPSPLANAPGTGVADDKAVYAYVP